jgi:hypothetical protein
MGRTIYVFDADDGRAALDQIKSEALASGGEDGGRIAALTGIAGVFLDRADKSRRHSLPQLLKAFSLYRAACELIFAMLEFDPLDALMYAPDGAAKAPALLADINNELARDWEIRELERRERQKAQREWQARPSRK